MSRPAWQHPVIRVFGWTAGAFWLVLFFGLTDLSVPVFFGNRPEFYEGYLIETGWGVLFTFFVGLPMCVLGASPRSVSVALMSAASGVAVLIAAVASAQPVQLIIVALLLLQAATVWALVRLGRKSPHESSGYETQVQPCVVATRIPILGLALISLPPAIIYAAEMIERAVGIGSEPSFTYVFDHYPIQAASALVIPLATGLMALQLQGWRPMTFLIALGTAWFGLISIVFPDHEGSWGTTWGWTAVAWAVALSLVPASLPRRSTVRSSSQEDPQRGGELGGDEAR